MKTTLLPLFCLVFLPSLLYSAELAKNGTTGWKTVLPTRDSLDLDSSGGSDRFTLGDLKRVMEAIGVARFQLIDDPGCHQCGGWVQFWK